jgi:translation elongation factor EF-Tu-like GTPase
MPARFQVEDTFEIASRRIFVAHGKVLTGTVHRGQQVVVPSGLSAPVDAVESVLLSATEGRENVALCFRYHGDEDLAQWQSLGLAGQTLELTDSRR